MLCPENRVLYLQTPSLLFSRPAHSKEGRRPQERSLGQGSLPLLPLSIVSFCCLNPCSVTARSHIIQEWCSPSMLLALFPIWDPRWTQQAWLSHQPHPAEEKMMKLKWAPLDTPPGWSLCHSEAHDDSSRVW